MQLCLMVATAYHYQQSGMPIELMIVPYLMLLLSQAVWVFRSYDALNIRSC